MRPARWTALATARTEAIVAARSAATVSAAFSTAVGAVGSIENVAATAGVTFMARNWTAPVGDIVHLTGDVPYSSTAWHTRMADVSDSFASAT